MIRPATLLWVGLAGAVGFGLFQLKHEVEDLEDEMFRLNRAIMTEQKAIHVLKAEWAYINQPERLQALAARHLDLQPMKPAQLGTLMELPVRGAEEAALPAMSAKAPQTGRKILSVRPLPPAAPRAAVIQVTPVLNTHTPSREQR